MSKIDKPFWQQKGFLNPDKGHHTTKSALLKKACHALKGVTVKEFLFGSKYSSTKTAPYLKMRYVQLNFLQPIQEFLDHRFDRSRSSYNP